MIVSLKRLIITVITISILIVSVVVMWPGNHPKASKIANKNDTEKNAPIVKSNNQTVEHFTDSISFFAEYRMERERIRGKQIELLREIINNEANDNKAREAASLRLVQISKDIENEMKIENMVKSRGYKECVVIFAPANTVVVIQSDHPDDEQEHEAGKLVSDAIGTDQGKIKVILRKLAIN